MTARGRGIREGTGSWDFGFKVAKAGKTMDGSVGYIFLEL